MNPDMITEGLKLLATVAAVFGGMKVSINGMRADVSEIKGTVAKIDEKVGAHGERIARLEAYKEADR